MKKWLFLVLLGLLFNSSAATYYVSASGGRSGAAGTEADPCSVIQDAVDKTVAGDTVVVAPGAYNTGGSATYYARVSITKNITLKSSHGAAVTFVEGSGAGYYGTTNARRGIYMTTGVVDGFTIRNGATSGVLIDPKISRGGGVLYATTPLDNVVRVKNCIIKDNKAYFGGGVYGTVTVGNCVFTGNVNGYTLGAGSAGFYIAALNCFFDASSSVPGYSLAGDETTRAYAMNCVFTANGALRPMTCATVYYSCTPFVDGTAVVNGGGNIISTDAKINTSTWRPETNSPCLNSGGITWNSIAIASLLPTDLNGDSRTNGNYDIGPVEWQIYKTTNVTASADNTNGVVLGWTAAEPDVSFYSIYRATTNFLPQATRIGSGLIKTATNMTYTDNTVGFRTNYYYWIQATNAAVRTSGSFIAHSFSDPVSGSRLTLTNETPHFSTAAYQIFTNGVEVSVFGTNIYYRVNGGSETYSAINRGFAVSNDTVITAQSRSDDKWDSGIATSMLYRAYQFTVNNQTNYLVSGTVTSITARVIPNRPFISWSGYTNSTNSTLVLTLPPQDVVLTSVYAPAVGQVGTVAVSSNADRILLEWSDVSGALLYEVQRGDSADGIFTPVVQTDLAFHQDTTAVPGRIYYYKVRAFAVSQVDEEQAGLFSDVVSGIRPAVLAVTASGFVQPLASSVGTCSVSVTANMEWTAVSRAVWITVTSVTAQGAGFTVLSNSTTTNSRTGVIRFILGAGVLTNDYAVTQSGNRKPAQPVGLSPIGTGVNPLNVLLLASAYSDSEGDAQSNTEWRVNGVVTSNPIAQLAYAADYSWQVRYQDPYSWSDWSTALSFSTLMPDLSVSLAATNAPKEGLVFDFTVISNCQWDVSADVAWLACNRIGNQVTVTVGKNSGDARTGNIGIHPIGTNGWMQMVTVTQDEWPIPVPPIPLYPLNGAVVTGAVQLVLQSTNGVSSTQWVVNNVTTTLFSVEGLFTNSVRRNQRQMTNTWSASFTDGVRWSASSATNSFRWVPTDTFYVSTNGNDLADGEIWGQAFRTIQRGIDLAPAGGTVLVGNGVYAMGGGVFAGFEARVLLTNSVTARSVGGAEKTIIQARTNATTGFGRCIYVSANAVMEGFTFTGGKAGGSGLAQNGGAIYLENNLQSVFRACILSNNAAQNGVVYQNSGGSLTFESCLFTQNSSVGYLVAGSTPNRLYNCTASRNSAGGLLNNAILYNTLIVSNTVNSVASLSGTNNSIGTFSAAQFVDFARNDFRLLPSAVSCIDKGTTNFLPYVLGPTDLSGTPRIQGRHPDIGAYETTPPPPTILRIF